MDLPRQLYVLPHCEISISPSPSGACQGSHRSMNFFFFKVTGMTQPGRRSRVKTEIKPRPGGQNSSVGSAWARCPQRRGFDPPLGTFSGRWDFSLGVNMGSDSIPQKLLRMRVQTCLLLRFRHKVYALKALFTLLRLSCQILRFWWPSLRLWINYDRFV